ncbi:diaminopimelate decarboxylase [Fimbriimonas ginsengisoli]|uniref:Diaminopimelate decarboxylase n=1 Tax=Fimbriimonas ginsengisoli Gsoil 348 TaxID=661478 RepID=A0A068NIM3_FIMGI|nr:diaminopimelate decarboxylase [Fimbriimonas ginsengisoli]AIE83453.1 diaminopimelate decarboxylase [Fimbriimonas ginsengisoli Gsoil 348]
MTTAPTNDTRFRVSESVARDLATAYGTPLYVLDEATFRGRIRAYREAFEASYPKSELTYAAKANSTVALLAIAAAEGCGIDVASEGELRAALGAGIPAARCHLHGNNKSFEELSFAIEQGIGMIVVDHFGEIETIQGIGTGSAKLALRLAPGVDPVTHAKISTGQADTKFGFNIADGSAERATLRCLELGLPLVGFHCHVGSQLLDPEAQRSGGELIARFAVDMLRRHGFAAEYLNVGGGLGASYTDADRPMNVRDYCRLIVEAVTGSLAGSGLDPVLAQEPGRSLVAETGVTLYTVGLVKTVPSKSAGRRTYVCVDGGLSDNPRPALYGARYDVERIGPAAGDEMVVTVSGKHCETDKLFEDVRLPRDVATGDLLQVLCTGAYNASMASNYNRFPRPAAALIRLDGSHCLVQRRDTWAEMLAREILPEGLA